MGLQMCTCGGGSRGGYGDFGFPQTVSKITRPLISTANLEKTVIVMRATKPPSTIGTKDESLARTFNRMGKISFKR